MSSLVGNLIPDPATLLGLAPRWLIATAISTALPPRGPDAVAPPRASTHPACRVADCRDARAMAGGETNARPSASRQADECVRGGVPMSAGTIRAPLTIGALPRRKAIALLSLFFVPAVAQAILLTVVPLEALHLLGDARAVTLLDVVAGLPPR